MVVVKRGRPNVAGIELGCFVDMQHIFRQLFIRGEVVTADKAFRVEKFFYPGVPPINGDGVHMEGVHKLLRAPTCPAGVFEGDVKAVLG